MASGGRWLEGTRISYEVSAHYFSHPLSPANNCCRYIFKLHTLRYNLQAFNLSLILLLILLLSNWLLLSPVWPLLLPVWFLLSPISPLLLPIWPMLPPDWLLSSPVWVLLSPVWALLSSDWLLSSPVWSLLSLLWHLSSRLFGLCLTARLAAVLAPWAENLQYNLFSSLREWTTHIKIVHGITYRCLEACCLYT